MSPDLSSGLRRQDSSHLPSCSGFKKACDQLKASKKLGSSELIGICVLQRGLARTGTDNTSESHQEDNLARTCKAALAPKMDPRRLVSSTRLSSSASVCCSVALCAWLMPALFT